MDLLQNLKKHIRIGFFESVDEDIKLYLKVFTNPAIENLLCVDDSSSCGPFIGKVSLDSLKLIGENSIE